MKAQYKAMKKKIKTIISKAKNRCWRGICDELENDVYGTAYKIVTSRLRAVKPNTAITLEAELEAARKLFIQKEEVDEDGTTRQRVRQ